MPMLLRDSKILVVLALAAFALLVAGNNVADYASNAEFVRQVLSMDTTFPGNRLMWRAITSPVVWGAAYWLIIATEALTGLCLLLGALRMLSRRRAPKACFEDAKAWAIAGATLGFLLWFFGFLVIGGEWFLMWQSELWNGQQAAFRIAMTMLGALIYLGLPEPEDAARR